MLDGLRRGSPQGLAESKRLVTAEVLRAFDRDTDSLAELSARLFASEEAREGMTAFLERREPAWVVERRGRGGGSRVDRDHAAAARATPSRTAAARPGSGCWRPP